MAAIVPALGSIVIAFQVDYVMAQFVISAYLFGLGFTQPVAGLLCDRLGRRPVMLSGIALFFLASIGCALAPNLSLLIFLRCLQAVGISVATVATRAIIRDTHDAEGAVRAIAKVAAAMGLAPAVAPVLGGFIGARFGYEGIFWLVALLALGTLGFAWRDLGETGTATRAPVNWRVLGRSWATLLGSPPFMAFTLIYGLLQGSFFAFIAVGATVFEEQLGLGQQAFGLIWGLLALGYVAGAVAAGRLVRRTGSYPLLRFGVLVTVATGWLMAMLVAVFGVTLLSLLGPLVILIAANGLVTPLAMAGAVNAQPQMAGTGAGLSSSLALLLSGVCSVVSGFIFSGSFTPIALLIAIAGTLSLLLMPLTRGVGKGDSGSEFIQE